MRKTLLQELLKMTEATVDPQDIEGAQRGVSGNRKQAEQQYQYLIGTTVNVVLMGGKFEAITRMGEPQTVKVLGNQSIIVAVLRVEQAGVSPQPTISSGSVYFNVSLIRGQEQQAEMGGVTKTLAEHFPSGKMIIRGSNLPTK